MVRTGVAKQIGCMAPSMQLKRRIATVIIPQGQIATVRARNQTEQLVTVGFREPVLEEWSAWASSHGLLPEPADVPRVFDLD